ncbi:MAG: anti-sigma factor family protein [Acidimicrobiia bacterium]
MHDSHDPDLIADYADGSRDPAAERLLDSCAECRAELALHQEMRSLLAGTAPVAMTDDERASLRSSVRAGIDQPAPVIPLAARRQSRWLKLGSVAAAMFVTVGLAGVFTQQGGNDTSDAFEAAAGSAESATEEVFSLEAATETTAAGEVSGFVAEERSADDQAPSGTTSAAESPPVGGADATAIGVGILTDAGPVTRVELDGQLDALIDLLTNQLASEQLDTTWFNDREIPAPSCLTSEALPVFGVINATIDDADVQAFVVFDATSSEYRADILLVDGCAPVE